MSGYHSRKPSNEFRMNIGTIIFAIIFFYIISATALIVRQEELVNATSSGYVSYYVRDGEKIGKNKTVYTIDETGSIYEKIKDADSDAFELTNDGLSEIRTRISNFENYFNYASFSDVYNFHYDIENAVLELTNEAMIEQLTSLDDSSTDISTYKKVTTTDSGIITYYKDGYENFDIHNFKASDINKSNYKKATLKTGEIINSGDPVYKLITSENWYLIAELSDKQVKELSDQDTVTVNIHNSSKNITCNFELTKQDNKNFIIISLNQQMVNYINDRFIDIVIIQDQNNGLKIPNTSITKKSVYKIPIDYLSQGSDSTSNNLLNIKVLDDKGEVTLKQVSPDIYKTDDEYCYVDPNDFGQNDVLVNTQNNDTLALNTAEKAELQGVFCVNQGIATFRYIDVLYQDDEYTIVKPEVPYSIAWYDRIILDQSLVKENQIIK